MDEAGLERLAEEATAASEGGDHVRALALADQLVSVRPNHFAVRLIRTRVLRAMGNAGEAFAEAQRSAELAPGLPEVRWHLAIAAWDVGKLGLAQQSFERAVALSRRDPALLAEYAWFMASVRGPRLAEKAAREAIDADPESATAWAALGAAQFRIHQVEEARTSLKRALELDPNSTAAQFAMVALLEAKKEDAKAGALASVMQDRPGAEDVAKAIRRDIRLRELDKTVLERKEVQDALFRKPAAQRWGWLISIVVAVMVVGALFAAGMEQAAGMLLIIFLIWRIRELVGW